MTKQASVEFTHRSLSQLGWTPSPGGKFSDGPRARMDIVRLDETAVWFRHVGRPEGGVFSMARTAFDRDYPGVLEDVAA